MKTPFSDTREDTSKRFRDNKKPLMLFPKHEDRKQYFHCSMHQGNRLIKTDKGLLCPAGCGYTSPEVRIVEAEVEQS